MASGRAKETTYGNTLRVIIMFAFILKGLNYEIVVSGDDALIIHEKHDTALVRQRIAGFTSATSDPNTMGLGYVIKEISTTEHYFTFLSKHGYCYKDQAILMRKPERFAKSGTYSTKLNTINMSEAEYNYVVTSGLQSTTGGLQILEDIVKARVQMLEHSVTAKTWKEYNPESGPADQFLCDLMYSRNSGPMSFRGDLSDFSFLVRNDVRAEQYCCGDPCSFVPRKIISKTKQQTWQTNLKTNVKRKSAKLALKRYAKEYPKKIALLRKSSKTCTTTKPPLTRLGPNWTKP